MNETYAGSVTRMAMNALEPLIVGLLRLGERLLAFLERVLSSSVVRLINAM
jgi:hypothetical protein